MTERSALSADLTQFAHRDLAVTIPDDWAPVSAVKDRLGMTQSLASQLMVSELVGDPRVLPRGSDPDGGDEGPWLLRSGSRLLMPRRGLERLAEVPRIGADVGPYLNIRVGPGTREPHPDGGRAYLGYHRVFTDQERYEAAHRWWHFTNPEAWIGLPLVASLAGYVTLAGRIEGVRIHPTAGSAAFELDTEDAPVRAVFAHRRIPIHRGGPALKIGAP